MLQHQLIVLRRKVRVEPAYQPRPLVPRPELVRWHRAGFRRYWHWKSNSRGGRPRIEMELRALIRLMSTENQL